MPNLETSINITAIQAGELAAKPSTPFSTGWKLYFKTDGLYQVDDAGVETALSGTAGPAPDDAEYVVTAVSAGLSAEVLLSAELSSPTAIGDVAASTGKFTTAETTSGADFNTGQNDDDFIVQGTTDATLFVGDAGADAVGIGIGVPTAKLHIDQSSASAAIPVLTLDQADISEEMFEFISTIGTGNAIEADGGKSLTATHFIKVTLPGPLTRYLQVGTIA